MQSQDLLERVRSVFVRMTRYPDEVIVPDADLEQDLGIDSVKRGEILATLRTEFGLSEALKAKPDELRTAARVADFLARTLGAGAGSAPRSNGAGAARRPNGRAADQAPGHTSTRLDVQAPAGPARAPAVAANDVQAPAGPTRAPAVAAEPPPVVAEPPPVIVTGPPAAREPLGVVVEVLAEVTRHPSELLVPDARLEEDLGIDHRRRDAVRALLRQRGALPDALATTLDTARTVGDIARLLGNAPRPAASAARSTEASRARSAAATGSALAGKTVLVTGSSRGLGRAIATALGRAGARVVVNSFHSRDEGEAVADQIRGTGGDAVHVWGSVANPAHIDALFGAIEREAGELHHFISNASNGRFGPLEQTTPEHWELAFRTNVVGYHQCAIRAARMMERHGGGRIVAVSSNGSSRYLEHFGAMGAVKAAVEALTRSLAVELAPRNVQVNTVSAGPIYGHVTSHYPDHERLLPYWESRTPGGRLCSEEDVAAAVLLLLSDGARRINGATVTVDGGGSLCI